MTVGAEFCKWLKQQKKDIDAALNLIEQGEDLIEEEKSFFNLFKQFKFCQKELVD